MCGLLEVKLFTTVDEQGSNTENCFSSESGSQELTTRRQHVAAINTPPPPPPQQGTKGELRGRLLQLQCDLLKLLHIVGQAFTSAVKFQVKFWTCRKTV